jgi:D-alanyl-D-alanine carboxypeptidase/D-alanyl-D-alanine-endopeptidase (penicillin-binding protein 4)
MNLFSIKKITAVTLACFLITNTNTQSQPKPKVTPLQKLQAQLREINAHPVMKHANWGFELQSLTDGKTLTSFHSERSLIPASTMKTVTTAAGLGVLGENYTFKTVLEYDGELLADGTLNGNLYIRGGADPSLGTDHILKFDDYGEVMKQWAEKIETAGIRKINGSVVGNADFLPDNPIPDGWQWADIGNYYGAPVCGLNINENYYRAFFKTGNKVGEPTSFLRSEPNIEGLRVENHVLSDKADGKDKAYIYGAPYSFHRYVTGTLPSNKKEFAIKGATPDPALLCAQMLDKRLKAKGISIEKEPTTTRILRNKFVRLDSATRKAIYTHHSPKLSELVAKTNVYSLNIYAEAILCAIGYQTLSEANFDAGTKAVQTFWQMRGLDTEGFFMYDGSGLSPTNAITPKQLCTMFYLNTKEPYYQTFYESLPVAGVSGTLSDMCVGTIAAGKIRAKSGTMTRVMCYAGYVKGASGKTYCFSFMANKYGGDYYGMRARVEKLMILMASL